MEVQNIFSVGIESYRIYVVIYVMRDIMEKYERVVRFSSDFCLYFKISLKPSFLVFFYL